jgi:hypothetical protein
MLRRIRVAVKATRLFIRDGAWLIRCGDYGIRINGRCRVHTWHCGPEGSGPVMWHRVIGPLFRKGEGPTLVWGNMS